MKEIYKKIDGYENYEVSNFGNVKSLNYKKTGKERLLKKTIGGTGWYYYVSLSKNGKLKIFTVHQLVAMAFLNHKPNGYSVVINHIDNNPLNNHVDNLELVSQRYNTSSHKTDPGLRYNEKKEKWTVNIRINNKNMYLGSFDNKNNAQSIYDNAIKNLDKFTGDVRLFRNLINPKSRKYEDIGIAIDTKNGGYIVYVKIDGKNIYIGRYNDKEIAKQMHGKAINNLINYNGNNDDFRKLIDPDSQKDRGVYLNNNKWRACIRINKIKIDLSSFNTKEEAKKVFDFAKTNRHIFDGDKKKFKEFCLLGELCSSD